MTTPMPELFTDDDASTEEMWRAAVEKALKGAFFDRLRSKTEDGLGIAPLYQRDSSAIAEQGRPAGARWRIVQRVDHPDGKSANAIALKDLENGADGLELVVAGAANAYGYGLTDRRAAGFEAALQGVYLDGIRVRLSSGPHGRGTAPALADAVEKLGYAPSSVCIDFALDPIGALAHRGDLADPWEIVAANLANTADDLRARGFAGPIVSADGRPYHNAGATEAQELAAIMATAVAYLRAFEASGWSLEDAASAIGFSVSVDADQFMGIAKIRALRRLWNRIQEASGIQPAPASVHVETSWRMMTRRDPWVNMLRTTVSAFAAGVGGADSLSVLPFTSALGLPDEFARRVARNTQAILLEESNLFRVADPGSGAGFIETMTDELAQSAWTLFQDIESKGGIVAALQSDEPQNRIAEANAARNKDIDKRKRAITGTSEFPNIDEKPVAMLDVAPVTGAAPNSDAAVRITPLAPIRLAEPFEALRDAAERHEAATGTRPTVFLANLGRIADFTARSTWIKNLFEAGGIAALSNEGFAGADAAAKAFSDSGAAIVCLCSADTVYADMAEDAAAALKAAGAKHVYLAGKPGDNEAALRSAGVDTFVFAGCDIVDTLRQAQSHLGMTESG